MNRNRLTDLENRLVVTWGEVGGRERGTGPLSVVLANAYLWNG